MKLGCALYTKESDGYANPLPMSAVHWPNSVPDKSLPVFTTVSRVKQKRSTTVPQMWIMDTGCGCDLIGKQYLTRLDLRTSRPAKDPLPSNAAGSDVDAEVPLYLKSIALGEAIEAHVLDRCPAALNVGGRPKSGVQV